TVLSAAVVWRRCRLCCRRRWCWWRSRGCRRCCGKCCWACSVLRESVPGPEPAHAGRHRYCGGGGIGVEAAVLRLVAPLQQAARDRPHHGASMALAAMLRIGDHTDVGQSASLPRVSARGRHQNALAQRTHHEPVVQFYVGLIEVLLAATGSERREQALIARGELAHPGCLRFPAQLFGLCLEEIVQV